MSVDIITGYRCSDGSIYADKKGADAKEAELNIRQWANDCLVEPDKARMDFVVKSIIEHHGDLRKALNGLYSERVVDQS